MGYRSDVVIAFAFESKEQIDEVMAIYRMDHRVQKHGLETAWTIHDWNGVWGLTYSAESIKWYNEAYEDVQGVEYMLTVVKQFDDEREEFNYAYRMIRIGEEDSDIETYNYSNHADLEEVLWDRIALHREIRTDF